MAVKYAYLCTCDFLGGFYLVPACSFLFLYITNPLHRKLFSPPEIPFFFVFFLFSTFIKFNGEIFYCPLGSKVSSETLCRLSSSFSLDFFLALETP